MNVADYPVTLAYGVYGVAGYTKEHPHRGRDFGCPSGTPLVVGGQQIGLSGATGKVTGPHCHVQEWKGDYANTREPNNAFQPGTVVNIDPNGTQGDGTFGKFITIRNADGWNNSYCHLSEIDVKVGDVIGGEMEPQWNEGDRQNFNEWHFNKDQGMFGGQAGGYKDVVGKISTSKEFKTEQFFNEGDVEEIQNALGTSDAASQVGKPWKNVWHEYIKPRIPKGAAPGTYLRVNKSDIVDIK